MKKMTSLALTASLLAGPLALPPALFAQNNSSDAPVAAPDSAPVPAPDAEPTPAPDSDPKGPPSIPPAPPAGSENTAGSEPSPSGSSDASPQADPPSRVARLNLIRGPITIQPSGSGDWIDANPNRPLTTGDHLWTDQDARGEMHIGSAAIRLSDHVGASILNLTDTVAQLQLAQGTIDVRIRELGPNETFEIDTANLAFTARAPGEYRIDASPNGGPTTITVRAGTGEVSGSGGGPYPLQFNRQYSVADNLGSAPTANPVPPRDAFDNFVMTRIRREEQSQSAQYVSRDMIGYDDLDEHGAWRNDPVYGWIWVPYGVGGGWAPYHHGHWANVYPWGWTWVADESWGFAPYHYGRWVQGGYGWAWIPGPRGPRPYYAPAMVGWVGGAGFGATVSFGGVVGVGWYPLGPRDVWVPPYRASPGYIQNMNVYNSRAVNVVQVDNYYGNYQRNPGWNGGGGMYAQNAAAVTAVPRGAFVGGQAVASASVRVSPGQLSNPQVVHGAAGFGAGSGLTPPSGASIPAASRPSSIRPPAALGNQPVFTRTAPSPRAAAFGNVHPANGASSGGHFTGPGAAAMNSSGPRPGAGGSGPAGQNPGGRRQAPGGQAQAGHTPGRQNGAGPNAGGQKPGGQAQPGGKPGQGQKPGGKNPAPKKPAPRKKPAPHHHEGERR